MNANLYITAETFRYNNINSIDDVNNNISKLEELINFVIPRKEDKFYLNWSKLYKIEVIKDYTLEELLLGNTKSEFRDVFNQLQTILINCEQIDISVDEIKSKVEKENNSAMVVFSKIDELCDDCKQVIANKQEWINYHRNCLYLYPCNTPKEYILEVKKYFDILIIHPSVEHSISKVYKTHLKRITNSLSILNDNLISDYRDSRTNDFVSFLYEFESHYSSIIDGASFAGHGHNSKTKSVYTKVFIIEDKEVSVICEPHLKMNKNDEGNKGHCRIYFNAVKKNDTKIYVGSIEEHI